MGDYLAIVRESEFVTLAGAWTLSNFVDILTGAITPDNQIEEIPAYGQSRGSRRHTLGGFAIAGDVSSAADFKTIGFFLKGVLGDSDVDDLDTLDYEHVFWGTQEIPSWVMFIGEQAGEATDYEFQYYGIRMNSLELSWDGPKSVTYTCNVGANYHIVRAAQLTPTWDDEPVCVGTDTTVQIGGVEVVVNALTLRIENNMVMDQFHLGGRHQGLRHQIVGTDDKNIMNSDTDWSADAGTTTADEATVALSNEGALKILWTTVGSADDTVINSGSITGADLRPYDRIGFWFRQSAASAGSEIYNFQLESDGYTTIYSLDSTDFAADTWYYIVIDISGDTRDNVDGFQFVAPAVVSQDFDMFFGSMQMWDSRKMPVQKRVISGTIDLIFQSDDQYQRFLDGTTTSTAAGVAYTVTSLNIDVLSDTAVEGGSGNEYYRMRLDMPSVAYKTPGGPALSGAESLRMSIAFDAFWATGTTANVYLGTHADAPANWDIMCSIVNNKAVENSY